MSKLNQILWFNEPDPVTPDDVSELERKLGFRLPEDYRAFLLHHSGAIPDSHTDFRFLDGGREFHAGVGTFLSASSESEMYIGECVKLLSGRISPQLLPIAQGPGGDYVCLDYRSSPILPSVIYWHHEREGLKDQYSDVAASFKDFVEMLYEPDIAAEEDMD